MKNKKLNITVLIITIICNIMLSGCETSEKFFLSATDSATITYSQATYEWKWTDREVLHKSLKNIPLNSQESSRIEIPSDYYLGYVVATDESTGLTGPIGINTHKRTKRTAKFLISCFPLWFISFYVIPILPGERMRQMSYYYEFGYDREQKVDMSGLSTELLYPDPPKNIENTSSHGKRKKYSSAGSDTASSRTAKAKTKNRNLSGAVVGTYLCSGKLLNGHSTDEEYSSVQIVIDQIDKTHVSVEVIESGESFFESPMEYTMKANDMNGYLLTLEGVPDATIEITKSGKITFLHKKVNIDGDIYTLSIKGNKRD